METKRTTTGSGLGATVESEAVSMRVLDAIAERKGVDPIDLDAPLNDVIDGDALDRLFSATHEDRDGHVRVEFTYVGYDVVVAGDDDVAVTVEEA